MRVTRISAGCEKLAGDKEYGNEKSKVELLADLEPGADVHVCLDNLLTLARQHIERDLSQSSNLNVRRSVIRARYHREREAEQREYHDEVGIAAAADSDDGDELPV